MNKTLPALLAAVFVCMSASHGQSILLGGFDGNQTQNTIAPATITSSTGVRELVGAKQDAGVIGAVTARIWTDQATNKELQWGVTNTSTTTGNWGLTDFTTDASTANDPWVVTQAGASWINYEISNTGTEDVTLDKVHISANRTGTGAPTTLTVSLQDNGTFANPPVLSASDLTAIGTQDVALSASTGWNHYEFALSSMLSDLILAPGEAATLRIDNNGGTARLYLDNIAVSGVVGSAGGGTVDAGTSTVSASPAAVPANGSSTSLITVTLKNSGGLPLAGKLVSLSGDGSATIAPAGAATDTTDANGEATFTVRSSTVGTETFTATSESVTITQTAGVEFQTVGSSGETVLLAGFDGNQTYIPGGTFQSEGDKFITNPVQSTAAAMAGFTAELYMFNDVAKEMQWGGAGQVSSGAWGSGAQGPFTPAPSTANTTNIYTVTIASTLEFRVENTGTDDITLEHIYFAALPGSSGVTEMTVSYASGDLSPLGGGSTVVTLTTTSNQGYDVDLTSILSDNVLGAGESAVFTLVTAAGSDRFRVDDVGMSGSVATEPAGPVDAGTSTVVASPASVLADGSSTSTITVTLKDASGKLVTGEEVTLANTSGPSTPTISPSATQTTDGSGVATFTVSSGTVGTEVFSATSSTDSVTVTQTASVDFQTVVVASPVDPDQSTVVASPTSVPADGTTTSTITVTLRDASGLAVEGEGVTLANTSGPGTPVISAAGAQTTNASGVANFTVSSGTPGTQVFTATSSTDSVVITQTASVVFTEVAAPLLVALLDDPVLASTSAVESAAIENFYDGNETIADIGTTNNRGSWFVATGVDSDGVSGTNAHTVVFDMGTIVSFDGFVHAQRKADGFDDVTSIDFWVTDTDPGDAATTIPLPIFTSRPTPDDTVNLARSSGVLNEYLLPGGTLTGRWVVMRLHSAGGNPGGYTLQLGRTGAVGDYDNWAFDYPGLGPAGGDDDGDGLTNDEERIFGLNPQNGGSANPYAVPFDAAAGTFSYSRRTQALTGLTYKIWYSTNLEEWFWESGAVQTPQSPVGGVEIVDVTIDPDLITEPRLFLQVSAEDLGPPPVLTSLWGSVSSITLNFSEEMETFSATNPANYIVSQDGGGSIAVSSAALSGDGKTVTLTLGAALAIDSAFTVTMDRIANGAGQPLGNGTVGQFRTWDNDPTGIKVFILAGQSNMVGYGHSELGKDNVAGAIGSLRYLAVNNGTYPEYDYTSLLVDPGQPSTSAWKTRGDVKYWGYNGASGNLPAPGDIPGKGDLGPPFRGANTAWFGPEYAFGQVLGDYYSGANEDVLIIKTAWGGHTLVGNFRPPSAVAARGGVVGASYEEIFNNAREVLLNLGTEFPEWSGRGYQIVGFGWHQGTSDKAPEDVANEYKFNLPDLIADVRTEFADPELPFVIATTGMSNAGPVEPYPYTGYHTVEKAQLWVAGVAQPANTLTDDTRGYWEIAADSPTDQGFHWNHNARSYFRVGLGLGNKMVDLLTP